MNVRLDKLLSSLGYGSRRDVKRLLRDRRLTVNGSVIVDPASCVDPDGDSLAIDGAEIAAKTSVYLMLNKPADVVTSTDDPKHRTVIDCLGEPWSRMDIFPVGRLDIDTEGLLIITNDGPLTHRLTSPKTGVDKTYLALLRDAVDDATLAEYAERFARGVEFRDGTACLPAKIVRAPDGVLITIQEGKYHQVKNMIKVVGNEVAYLRRVSMGPLDLDPSLAPGEYRPLTDGEIELLKNR
jgi:16S rRNA pseudouridine516 synthase